MKLRIIGGKDGGKHIKTRQHPNLRPTPQKVKEALFDIIGDIQGNRFLDIFAGTGQIGIEALSRYAAFVTFVEKENIFTKKINENINARENCKIIQGDVYKFLLKGKDDPYNIIFADPPFFLSMYEKIFETLRYCEMLADNTLLILEHHHTVELPENVPPWQQTDCRRYGDILLAFYMKKN